MSHYYSLKYRPASFATCPKGWKYAASGSKDPLVARPELPRSNYPFGVIVYPHPLTPYELESFEMFPVPAPEGATT